VHERAGDADVLITTYGTLVRDIEMLEQRRFSLVVADESQNIRNPKAQSAKTVRRLQADRFLNLTGTPLENRLLDLWAQMDLAVPGLLGSARGFTRQVANPIQNKGSEMHRAALARRIAPFLLRRTKQEVASELPEKITTTIEVELAPAQRTLYETLRAAQHAASRRRSPNGASTAAASWYWTRSSSCVRSAVTRCSPRWRLQRRSRSARSWTH